MQGADARTQGELAVSDRATTFSAEDDSGPPASMKTFGVIFGILWLGMLALVFVTRRRQVRLRANIEATERMLTTNTERMLARHDAS